MHGTDRSQSIEFGWGDEAMPETFEVNCPCCETFLVIDRDSGQIVFHKEKEKKTKLSLDAMLSDLSSQKDEAAKRFAREMESQKDRGKILDARFREAVQRADKSDKPMKNPLDLD